jgi:hypothetical protein
MGRSPLEPLEALHALTTSLPSVAPSLGLRKLANLAVVMSLLRKALLSLSIEATLVHGHDALGVRPPPHG